MTIPGLFPYVGMLVQTSATPNNNGGTDIAPAIITAVKGTLGPQGGALVNIKVWPNSSANMRLAEDVQLFMYEEEARRLAVERAAWPRPRIG